MTPVQFHIIAKTLLLAWAFFATVIAISPRLVVRILLQNRVDLSLAKTVTIRILAIVNAFGALITLWNERY